MTFVVPLDDVKRLQLQVMGILETSNLDPISLSDVENEFRFILESETFPKGCVPYKKINLEERDKEISELKESKKKAATICAKWIWDNYEIAKDMSMVVLVEHLEKELEVSGKK